MVIQRNYVKTEQFPVSHQVLSKKIIDNQVYMGKIAYGRRRTEKKTGTRNETHIVEQSEFPVYEGIHEANLDVTDIHYDKKFQICRDD